MSSQEEGPGIRREWVGHTGSRPVSEGAEGAGTCGLETVSMEKSEHGRTRRYRKGRISSLRAIELSLVSCLDLG